MSNGFINIVGYEGLYQINASGVVVSMKTDIKDFCILTPYLVKGYPAVKLYIDGRGSSKQILVHRLVAIHFIPNPENKPQVNHINGVRGDSRAENLEWVTARENQTHRINKLKNSSKYTGVSWNKQRLKWSSQIGIKDEVHCIGFYDSELEASQAYSEKLKELNLSNKYAV